MSSRPTLAVLISVATVLAVGGAIEGWRFAQRMARWRNPSAPVLDEEELRRYITFRRPCHDDNECEKPLACTLDVRMAGYFCLPSECATDWQCQPGFSCTAIRGRPIVRLCYATGTRQEGERCYDASPYAKSSCAPGLICMRGECGRRCEPDDPASCPRGTTCRDSRLDGHACQPNCAPGDCPSGQRCVRFDDELALCGTSVGANCDESPCGVDQICEKAAGLSDKIAMRCVPQCAADKPCPEGYSCEGGGECLRVCKKDSDCGLWEECDLIISLKTSFCFLSVRPNAPP